MPNKSLFVVLFLSVVMADLNAQSKNSARVIHDGNSECNKLTGDAQKACYDRIRAENTAKFFADQKARKEKLAREEEIKKRKREEESRKRALEQEKINEQIERERKEKESKRKFIQIKLPGEFASDTDSDSRKTYNEDDSTTKSENQLTEKEKYDLLKFEMEQRSRDQKKLTNANYYTGNGDFLSVIIK